MTDLDRLLELRRIYRMTPKELDECKSLKAKIEGKIDEGIQQEKADLLSILDMKDEEVAKLKEDNREYDVYQKSILDLLEENKQLKSTLDEIKTLTEGSPMCTYCDWTERIEEILERSDPTAKHEDI